MQMNEDFMKYVYERISKTLSQNGEYMKLQSAYTVAEHDKDIASLSEISIDMESTAQELCYLAGFHDAIKIMSMN